VAGYDPPEDKDDIFFLSVDGTIKQLTVLSDYFSEAIIFSTSWSPDENLIAFEILINQNGERKLLILNMSTLEIIDLCLSPQPFTPMIWSPDSRYLAYSEELTNDSSQTVLVDLVDRNAFVVADEVLPAGWVPSTK
jgi:Tol biopolymer transport system component